MGKGVSSQLAALSNITACFPVGSMAQISTGVSPWPPPELQPSYFVGRMPFFFHVPPEDVWVGGALISGSPKSKDRELINSHENASCQLFKG